MADAIAAERLRAFIERLGPGREAKKGMADDFRDVYNEAGSRGR